MPTFALLCGRGLLYLLWALFMLNIGCTVVNNIMHTNIHVYNVYIFQRTFMTLCHVGLDFHAGRGRGGPRRHVYVL